VWGLLLAALEIALGSAMLAGGRPARVGWVAMIGFQLLLVLFGWGFLVWSVPAAAVLAGGARHDWAVLGHAREDGRPRGEEDVRRTTRRSVRAPR
jgi:hypothetical protein